MVASNASLILLQWTTLERQVLHEEAQELVSLFDAKTLFYLPLPHLCYLPSKIQGTHYRSFY
jgi:hypothetical protein